MSEIAILQEQGQDCMGLGGTFLSEEDQNRYNDQNEKEESTMRLKADEPTR